jgi:hypothetical protein
MEMHQTEPEFELERWIPLLKLALSANVHLCIVLFVSAVGCIFHAYVDSSDRRQYYAKIRKVGIDVALGFFFAL